MLLRFSAEDAAVLQRWRRGEAEGVVGQCLHGVCDEERVIQGEFEVYPGCSGRVVGWLGAVQGVAVLVESQRTQPQFRGLAQQVEQLGRVKPKVAIVQSAQMLVAGRTPRKGQAAELVLEALPF